jgi:hypothetical protein
MVVCAADLPDEPVIYCSEGFEILTQYHSTEVLGQNCRFLQAANIPVCKQGVVVVYGLMYECIVVCMYKCVI